MVTLLLDQTQLEVVLSPVERAATFHRENLRIARETITKVQLTEDAWTWLRGVPNPGAHIPGILAAGTWKAAGSVDFVLIRRRRPGVVIDLDGDDQYQRLILTTKHGVALTQALRLDVSTEPANVEEIVATAPTPVVKGSRRPVIRPRPA
jgi:predicted thioredoxin/glutaredoxin